MARPRKELKFAGVLRPLCVADLKLLKEEVTTEIRLKKQEELRMKREQAALKMRNNIRIGQTISFVQSGLNGNAIKAEVIGIFVDKVQVKVGGRKRSISLTRIQSIE